MSNKIGDKNVANDIKILKKFCEYEEAVVLTDNALEEVQDAMQNILAEREQKDKRIQELEEERDHWHGCFIVAMENSIAKEKVKDILQNNRNELFSMTYLSKEQYKPYEMQVERINKIEQELLEGERE